MANGKGSVSAGGVAAHHDGHVALPVLVGPATGSEFNTFRPPFLPIACWRLENMRFDFDSSFVRPEASAEFRGLAALWKRVGHPPLSVFGHADPVGDDDYNKKLSGRRAIAVYAMLTRKTEKWEELFSQPMSGDNWGLKTTQMMLDALGKSPGPPDGVMGASTRAAVKEFQSEHGLAADGDPGPKTRKELFLAYMDLVCVDETGAPFVLAETDFLAQGKDPDGKGDFQGCSEFNPLTVFSKDEDKEFKQPAKKAERDAANQPNRRVLIFLFPPGTVVPPELWPCPRAKEGVAACKAQFWPDAELRRNPQDAHREYAKSKDTFACRFYDGMARRSPCETIRQTLVIRLFDADKEAVPNAVYRLSVGGHDVRERTAGPDGRLLEESVLAPSRVQLQWRRADQDGGLADVFPFELSIFLDFAESDEDEASFKRLHNLGYSPEQSLSESVRSFQEDYKVVQPPNGNLDPQTRAKLQEVHDNVIAKSEA